MIPKLDEYTPPPAPNVMLGNSGLKQIRLPGYKGISIVIWDTKDVLECPPAPAECAFPTGQSVLDYLEFDGGNGELWVNTLALVSRENRGKPETMQERMGAARTEGEKGKERRFNAPCLGDSPAAAASIAPKSAELRKHSLPALLVFALAAAGRCSGREGLLFLCRLVKCEIRVHTPFLFSCVFCATTGCKGSPSTSSRQA